MRGSVGRRRRPDKLPFAVRAHALSGAGVYTGTISGGSAMPENANQPTLFSEEALAAISRSLHAWEEGPLAKTLQRNKERRPEFSTTSATLQRMYTPLDIADFDYERDLGFPGEYPFTRGVQTT